MDKIIGDLALTALIIWFGGAIVLRVVVWTYNDLNNLTGRAHPRNRARVQKQRALARKRAQAPKPQPVPVPIPSWLPISHDDVLLCLSPGVRADFQKDEPQSSSISNNTLVVGEALRASP